LLVVKVYVFIILDIKMIQVELEFRKAEAADSDAIWTIIQQAIRRRGEDGSIQWQDGYPNPEVIALDIQKGAGNVALEECKIVAYGVILVNDEPEYERLHGKWLRTGDYVAVHRIAVADSHLGRGLATAMMRYAEAKAHEWGIGSVRVDTNYDNYAMLHIFDKLGFTYCGEVYFRGSPRRAYEKVLVP
jgi:GNAT superfamily N-acetyltransferase